MIGIYCGAPPVPGEIWARWNLDPTLLAALVLLSLVVGRERSGRWAVVVLAVVFVSPLCALSSALFSARALHHVLLVTVAAPLLALAWPARSAAALALPLGVSTAVLWTWHLPAAYDLALSHKAVYWIMQITLLASALWFWRNILARECPSVDAVLFVVGGFAQMGLLGALLTFAPAALYEAHALAPLAWGMTPLADQQLAGLLMWVPAGIPYAVAAAHLARRAWSDLGSTNA